MSDVFADQMILSLSSEVFTIISVIEWEGRYSRWYSMINHHSKYRYYKEMITSGNLVIYLASSLLHHSHHHHQDYLHYHYGYHWFYYCHYDFYFYYTIIIITIILTFCIIVIIITIIVTIINHSSYKFNECADHWNIMK